MKAITAESAAAAASHLAPMLAGPLRAGRAASGKAAAMAADLKHVPPFALLAALLILPVTMAIANALALWPGHRAARFRPAEVLRAE